jgi:hypothetical protein
LRRFFVHVHVHVHVHVLSRLFRRLFIEGLLALHRARELVFFGDLAELSEPQAFAAYLAPLRKTEWVVYAKPPFGGPECVFRGHPATDSESIRPPIPILSGHRFRGIRPPCDVML